MSAGAEFLAERLSRAAAIPAAERSGDVAAFVESQQLLAEMCELMPLAGGGQPALPPTAASYRRVLAGLLRLTRAYYICPIQPPCGNTDEHLHAYLGNIFWWSEAEHAAAPSKAELAIVRALAVSSNGSLNLQPRKRALAWLRDASNAAGMTRMLSELSAVPTTQGGRINQQQGQRQQGQDQPVRSLLSLSELQHELSTSLTGVAYTCLLANFTGVRAAMQDSQNSDFQSLAEQAPQLSEGEAAELKATARSCCQLSLQLFPYSPRSHMDAAYCEEGMGRSAAGYLRAFKLAWHLRSDVLAVSSMSKALGRVAVGQRRGTEVPRAIAEEALAALDSVGRSQAVASASKVLPREWVVCMQRDLETARQEAVGVRAELARPGSTRRGPTSPAVLAQQLQSSSDATAQRLACGGCDKRSDALRLCAQCRRTAYCSRECQVAAWPCHKLECRKTGGAGT